MRPKPDCSSKAKRSDKEFGTQGMLHGWGLKAETRDSARLLRSRNSSKSLFLPGPKKQQLCQPDFVDDNRSALDHPVSHLDGENAGSS